MKHNHKKGFSLIEILFAVFICVSCVAVLAATMPIATQSRTRADMNNKATSLCQKQIEAVRAAGYPNLTADQLYSFGLIDSKTTVSIPGQATPSGASIFSFTNVDNGKKDNPATILTDGKGYITVEQVDLDLRRVTVEVHFTDRGRARSVKLGTLVANL